MAPLPFELQVLEAMLKDIATLANQLTKDLEAVAHPALDALTKTVPYFSSLIRPDQTAFPAKHNDSKSSCIGQSCCKSSSNSCLT